MANSSFSDYGDFQELIEVVDDAVESGEATELDGGSQSFVAYDTDGDDGADIFVEDHDSDGTIDRISVDEDGDRIADTAFVDSDQDGVTDRVLTGAAEGDPKLYATMMIDEDQDGDLDTEYTWDVPSEEWIETDSGPDVARGVLEIGPLLAA
ncbi:MAG: hypothetical protein ACSLE6_03955 [Mycobacterium sp.]